MSETSLVEDIITTRNTLSILHRIFIANQDALQPFVRAFHAIVTLIHAFTHVSVKEIEAELVSTGSEVRYFNQLRETLKELSDAISRIILQQSVV